MPGGSEVFVDLDALGELARQLRGLRSELESVGEAGGAPGGSGSEPIEDAVARFVAGWRDGRRRVVEGLARLISEVEGAADAYRQNERRLAGAAGGPGVADEPRP